MNETDNFMWGFQGHFADSASYLAEKMFQFIDPEFDPVVFLVGLTQDGKDGVAVVPSYCGYASSDFNGLSELTEHKVKLDPKSRTRQSHPIAPKYQDQGIRLNALRDAIKDKCNARYLQRQVVTSVSLPALIDRHYVAVVIQLPRILFDKIHHLNKTHDASARFTISRSLLEALINIFLQECHTALLLPEPGARMSVSNRNIEELFRDAAKLLMYVPAIASDEQTGLYGLYTNCNIISSLKYEGGNVSGRMLIAKRGHCNIEEVITFENRIPLMESRRVRKLLEICGSDLALLASASHIFALGRKIGKYDHTKEDLFEIEFNGHYQWELLHDSHSLMRVSYEKPDILRQRIDKEQLSNNLDRILGNLEIKQKDRLWHLVDSAAEQKHGTIVIITRSAKEEAARLCNQSFKIDPTVLTPETIRLVSAIDGAVLLDQDAVCHAIGVILDGVATEKGSPTRGARFNSSIRYIEQRKGALAIIISSDGSIDMYPNFRPRIRKSQIEVSIRNFEALLSKNELAPGEVSNARRPIERYRFYLTNTDCDKLNQIQAALKQKFPNAAMGHERQFTPDPEMNDSYLMS